MFCVKEIEFNSGSESSEKESDSAAIPASSSSPLRIVPESPRSSHTVEDEPDPVIASNFSSRISASRVGIRLRRSTIERK